MAKITFVDKVENEGATPDGKVFAVEMNSIKSVVNTNEDLRLAQTILSGIYSIGSQSLVFRNAANAIVFSVSLSDLVTGGGGIGEAPIDNAYYSRRNGGWASFTPGIADAPNNTNIYGRSGQGWVAITAGIADALSDGNTYGRRNGAWVQLGSGGGVSIHNELSGRSETGCHPISSITDLQTALNGKAALAGNINQDFSAKVLTVGNSIVLNSRTLTIRTL